LPPKKCTMVVFGGTGDLTSRKLVPAVYNLHKNGQLPEGFTLIGISRSSRSSEEYREELAKAVKETSKSTWDEKTWLELAAEIHYYSCDLKDSENYPPLKEAIEEFSRKHGAGVNYLYFLAVAPPLFAPIADNLKKHGMAVNGTSGMHTIMIEKPFGSDLQSARDLNQSLTAAFHEENIFRIDHYLGKEMLQNILVIRFANTVFEPLWNNKYIDHIQITSSETGGIGDRGHYYDQAGELRDMVQSHLLQMLAVTAMEPPGDTSSESIRAEKLKLLDAVRLWPEGETAEKIVFGQYEGFRQEKNVDPASETETYAAIKLEVNNERWKGVPFYLKTGKQLRDKMAKIVIQYKKPSTLYFREHAEEAPIDTTKLLNLLTLKVQPREGVVFQFNIKKPSTVEEIVPVDMDFCQPCAFLINTPEAYERLIADAMEGDPARFTSWDEVESSWILTDSIYDAKEQAGLPVYRYEPGGVGPSESEEMMKKEGRCWWLEK
jgi:glucose-6-phosphate 1-dehydrogenase